MQGGRWQVVAGLCGGHDAGVVGYPCWVGRDWRWGCSDGSEGATLRSMELSGLPSQGPASAFTQRSCFWMAGGRGALWVSGRRPSGFPAIQVGWRLRGGATLQGWGGGRQGARLPFSQVLPQVSPVPDGRAGSAPTLTFRFGSLPEATRCLMADSGKAKFPVVLCHVTFSPPARLPPEEVS